MQKALITTLIATVLVAGFVLAIPAISAESTKTINADKVVIKKGEDITINVNSGKNGKDGINGTNGKDGAPGVNGTNGKDGAPGINGTNGKDGINGTNGKDGVNGTTLPEQDLNDIQTILQLYRNGSLSSVNVDVINGTNSTG